MYMDNRQLRAALLVWVTLLWASDKYKGGSYSGSSMASLPCTPVVLTSNKFNGGPYDGESMVSLPCTPVVITSNKFNGGPYDGESMVSLPCTPVVLTSNKFNGGPYDGESMGSLPCTPVVLVSNKFNGGPYDGESMGMLSNPCGPPLGISEQILLQGHWLTPGDAFLSWSYSYEAEISLYVLFRQAAGSSTWTPVATALPDENGSHVYEATDRGLPPGHYLYRVEAVTQNGLSLYSNAVELGYTESIEPEIVAYPNPAREAFHLRVYLPYDSEVLLEGWDMTGRLVIAEQYLHRKGQWLYTISLKGFSQGMYSFRLQALSSGEGWDFRVLKTD